MQKLTLPCKLQGWNRTKVELAPDAERLLCAGEHVDEEHDAAVEEECLDEARLGQDGVVQDVQFVQSSKNVGLLCSELFLQVKIFIKYKRDWKTQMRKVYAERNGLEPVLPVWSASFG